MTASTDFDRFLASVLDVDGPQTVDPSVVDTALASVRALPQRRPLIRGLDRRAWPSVRPIRRPGQRLALVLVVVGALVGIFVAAILAGPGASRWELAGDDRIVVMGSGRVVVVDADGAVTSDGAFSRGSCVQADPEQARISPDGSRVAVPLVPSGITVASTDGAASVDIRTEEAIVDVAWSADGQWLAARENARILLIRRDHPVPVTIGADGTIHGFAWTPDSSSLLIAAHDNGGTIVLQRVDVIDQRREHLADLGTESDWRFFTCIRIEE